MPTVTVTSRARSLAFLVQLSLLAGPFLSMVDSGVVNVALPDIARQLHAALDTAQWIVSGYLLSLAVVLPASAYLARRFGTRRIYLASLVGFTLASALCALSPSIGFLIAARIVQGACGAPMVPLAMNLLLGPSGEARQMPAAAGMLLFLAPALGPTAGGLLIALGGWPLIFLVNVPFGALSVLGIWRSADDATGRGDRAARFDPFGLALLAVGLALATYGATTGAQQGWTAPGVWPYWASGVALLAAYLGWALVRRHPALDLKLLRHQQSLLSLLVSAAASVVMFAMLVLIPVFMQDLQGSSSLVAGLTLLPQGLAMGVSTVLGIGVSRRWGVRRTVVVGMLVLGLSTALLLTLRLDSPAWITAALLSGRGLALGLTINPLVQALTGDLGPAELADGTTLFNVAERLSGSVGIALLATLLQQREQIRVTEALAALHIPAGGLSQAAGAALPPALRSRLAEAAVQGFHDTILALVALAFVGMLLALLLRSQRQGTGMPIDGAVDSLQTQAGAQPVVSSTA
jgi:EmrB/QacA subfamily drug resistance transporter